MRMEVRCCCQPQKLLGTIEVPDGTKCGSVIRFSAFRYTPLHPSADEEILRPWSLQLECHEFYAGFGRQPYPAIKAESVSLETLRLIPTFQERLTHEQMEKAFTALMEESTSFVYRKE